MRDARVCDRKARNGALCGAVIDTLWSLVYQAALGRRPCIDRWRAGGGTKVESSRHALQTQRVETHLVSFMCSVALVVSAVLPQAAWLHTGIGTKSPDKACVLPKTVVGPYTPSFDPTETLYFCRRAPLESYHGEGLPTGISKRQKEASIRKHYERCDRDEVRKALSAAKFGRKQELLRHYGHEVDRISLRLEIQKEGSEQHTWGYGCRRCARFTKNMRHLKDKRCGGTGERARSFGEPSTGRGARWARPTSGS